MCIYAYSIKYINDFDYADSKSRGIVVAENIVDAIKKITEWFGDDIQDITFEEVTGNDIGVFENYSFVKPNGEVKG